MALAGAAGDHRELPTVPELPVLSRSTMREGGAMREELVSRNDSN